MAEITSKPFKSEAKAKAKYTCKIADHKNQGYRHCVICLSEPIIQALNRRPHAVWSTEQQGY